MGWVTEFAPTREELSACVECGLCLPHCPTFRLTGDETASPRGRLTAMSAVAAGEATIDAAFEEMMSFCLQCRACETACPSLVPFARAMEGARAELSVQRPKLSRRLRHMVLGRMLASRPMMVAITFFAALAQRLRLGALLPSGLRGGVTGLRPLPLRAPTIVRKASRPDPQRSTAAVLAGCVMDPWFGPVHEATVGLLDALGYAVVVPSDQTCCGALAAHDGAARAAQRMARRNVSAFGGVDLVVTDSAGCGAHLKEYGNWAGDAGAILAARVRDVTEVVDDGLTRGLLPTLAATGLTAAIQDPCHLRHGQKLIDPPRRILAAAGFRVAEVDPDGSCCGAAGIYSLTRSETSAELGRKKAEQVRLTGATTVASANPGCEIQLRAYLGSSFSIAHPAELYWNALRSSPGWR